jgi:hypothetical protein
MRFIPRSPDKLQLIQRADRLRPSTVDGSHQLREEIWRGRVERMSELLASDSEQDERKS